MKILAITASGRKKGNSVIAATYIAKQLDAELEILNLTKLNIEPCKACYACLYGEECKIEDDVGLVYERIKGNDVILICSPVYWLDATGKMKALVDRQFMAIPYLKEFSKKYAAIITPYGFKELKGWASATHIILTKVLGLNLLVNAEINAALPGEILIEKESMKKLEIVIEAIKNRKRIVLEDQCPVCLNSVFRIDNGILCPICGSKLDLKLNVLEKGDRLELKWMVEHYEVLRNMKEEFKRKKEEIFKVLKMVEEHGT
ncbi:flavodoxin family protein [Archaeoglobales archaeon]|nr:MAG: flavodoxin family protein [Archaeoglobales archaeon]